MLLVITAAYVAFKDTGLWRVQETGSKVCEEDYGEADGDDAPAMLLLEQLITVAFGAQQRRLLLVGNRHDTASDQKNNSSCLKLTEKY